MSHATVKHDRTRNNSTEWQAFLAPLEQREFMELIRLQARGQTRNHPGALARGQTESPLISVKSPQSSGDAARNEVQIMDVLKRKKGR